MIVSIEHTRVYLALGATDMGKQIDGLAALVEDVLEQDPFSNCLFAFCNRRRDEIKILLWQRNGFSLWYRRLERIVDLPESKKQAMGADWTFIGYDESEQLAVIPRQPYVILFNRAKYVPIDEDIPGGPSNGVAIAPHAPQILPKAIGHSSLIADVVVGKFVDALPLYRQEKIFAREGIDISRQTMAGWMIQRDEKLSPLLAAMKAVRYQGRGIHIDETRLQVLNEPGREASQQSYMWVYHGGPPRRQVLWFQYAETRSKPILDKIKAWLEEKVTTTLPKGLLGKAIAYALGLWAQLNTCLEDGHIPIDNNLVENAIRAFVVGRKAWLFSGSPAAPTPARHSLPSSRRPKPTAWSRAPTLPSCSSAYPRRERPRTSTRSCPEI